MAKMFIGSGCYHRNFAGAGKFIFESIFSTLVNLAHFGNGNFQYFGGFLAYKCLWWCLGIDYSSY
jgi:hypothetical protein